MKLGTLLQGAIDIHVHCRPDVIARDQDVVELARSAVDAKMGGMLIKDHTTCIVGRVHTINRTLPLGIRFYSALALNPPVGGLNPCAVESALRAGTDVIYFPTYGAKNHIHIWGAGKPPTAFPLPEGDYRGISIHDKDGNLRTKCETILTMIARHDAVLATGHLSPEESLDLLTLARSCGVKRMVVTHASESVTAMHPNHQQRAVSLGAIIEHCFFAVTESCPQATELEEIKRQIRQVGVEHVILSSDFGQIANGPVVEGFACYLEKMMRLGFTTEEIRVMIADNPGRLLKKRKNKREKN